ncbi:MAG: HNH endonuclease [Gemmatimonadetes bacterium]|nr:HNH endonuclease [Gemmatimonadota bacterium]
MKAKRKRATLESRRTANRARYRRHKRRMKMQVRTDYARRRYHGDLSKEFVASLFERQRQCFYCGIELTSDNASLEHIRPELGNAPDNMTVACIPCNCSKGADTPEQFAMRLAQRGIHHALLPADTPVQKRLI